MCLLTVAKERSCSPVSRLGLWRAWPSDRRLALDGGRHPQRSRRAFGWIGSWFLPIGR